MPSGSCSRKFVSIIDRQSRYLESFCEDVDGKMKESISKMLEMKKSNELRLEISAYVLKVKFLRRLVILKPMLYLIRQMIS